MRGLLTTLLILMLASPAWAQINVPSSGGSGGASQADLSAFADGSASMNPIGCVFNAGATDPSAGQAAGVRCTAKRAMHVTLYDSSGSELSVGGGTQYDQGTATTSTDKLSMFGAVRRDTAAIDAGVADGDRLTLSTDASGRLRVTAVDTTQPVSGTVTANAGTNLNTSALLTTTAHDAAFGTAGSADTQVRTVQGIASMTPLLISGTGTAGSAATAVVTVQGIASMTKLLVTPDANSAVNVAQIAGSTVVADPCQVNAKSYGNIQQTSGTQIITGTSAKRVYFCSFNVVAGAAQNISVVAGTGSVCATNTVAVPGLSGGATAATGWNLAANGGLAFGNGQSALTKTTVDADNVCILQSGSAQLSGGFSYVVQ